MVVLVSERSWICHPMWPKMHFTLSLSNSLVLPLFCPIWFCLGRWLSWYWNRMWQYLIDMKIWWIDPRWQLPWHWHKNSLHQLLGEIISAEEELPCGCQNNPANRLHWILFLNLQSKSVLVYRSKHKKQLEKDYSTYLCGLEATLWWEEVI